MKNESGCVPQNIQTPGKKRDQNLNEHNDNCMLNQSQKTEFE